ncbi:acyltransferase [Gilvimarinus sp. HB14]|uniref:Acyltransferase n=2 Tax=Gilvimarinus xylanilyticus TaxID=2944139 RepID=A0A9X2HVV6_9GAMM|nr:acyltransferase [Gilvimarinus xylanilyticus]
MVFAWHFLHSSSGDPVPFEGVPAFFPFALLDEGHTGVALFMGLSGYLFAKLLEGRRLHYGWFLWNRAIRLLPLLVFVIAVVAFTKWWAGESLIHLWRAVYKGVIYPTLPNGGWSITVEFHFYLLLPVFLALATRRGWYLLLVVAGAIVVRAYLWFERGEVQSLAYWTLVGRVDQFLLGMVAYRYRHWFVGRHARVTCILLLFAAFYAWFDWRGGFYLQPSYPSPNAVWVYLPALEGVAWAVLIAWYDGSFRPRPAGVSGVVAKIGAYSYSIYLFHFFIVFRAADWVDGHIMSIGNFYVAVLWSLLAFVLMWPVGYLSFRYIESPFLRWRRSYLLD